MALESTPLCRESTAPNVQYLWHGPAPAHSAFQKHPGAPRPPVLGGLSAARTCSELASKSVVLFGCRKPGVQLWGLLQLPCPGEAAEVGLL
jgi:hypothetical protein